MTDQKTIDKAKAIERAESYRSMMILWAWKDFNRMLKEKEMENEVTFHSTSQEKLTPMAIGEYRGWKKAFMWIESELEYILNGAS
jgi:hypothetical protein